jgi:fructoselysine transporter
MVVVVGIVLWRKIESIGKLTTFLWGVMILSVGLVILAALTHFHASQAFTFPAHAFELTHGSFWLGFVGGLTIGIYDYLGYNTVSYMGAEVKNPGRVIPRAIIYAVFAIMVIYLTMQIGVLGVVRWQDMLDPNKRTGTCPEFTRSSGRWSGWDWA